MHIVREWTWYACKDLNMTPPHSPSVYNDRFIPDFMATCALAHDLDFANAAVYVPEMGVYRFGERPPCLIRDGRYFVVHDFVTFLQYKLPWSLRAGHNFMR